MKFSGRLWLGAILVCLAGCEGGRQMVMSASGDVKPEEPNLISSPPPSSKAHFLPARHSVVNEAKEKPVESSSVAVVDSRLTLEEALKGTECPNEIRQAQALVDVQYYSFDGKLHAGQLVVNKALAPEVKEIFKEIEESKFPIARVIPISRFGWSDDDSVAADNTSGFNYRIVPATHHLSLHAYGRAIDLNPAQNPYMDPVRGTDQKYDPAVPGALTRESAPTVIFRKHGWSWGGVWRRGRDYQHFEKL